jgi:hypothetical protein
MASTLMNHALVWWNNLHDYDKPQICDDVKALMREQFVFSYHPILSLFVHLTICRMLRTRRKETTYRMSTS